MKKVIRVKKKGDPEKDKKKKKGKGKKVYVDSKDHPRNKAYKDSLSLHKKSDDYFNRWSPYFGNIERFKKGSSEYKKIMKSKRYVDMHEKEDKRIKPQSLYRNEGSDKISPYFKKPKEEVIVDKLKSKQKPREKQKSVNHLKSKGVDSKTPKPKAKKVDTDEVKSHSVFGKQNKKTPYNLSTTKATDKDKSNKQTRSEYRQHNLNPVGKPYPETKPEVVKEYDKRGLVNKKWKEEQKKKSDMKKVVRVKKKDGILPKEAFERGKKKKKKK